MDNIGFFDFVKQLSYRCKRNFYSMNPDDEQSKKLLDACVEEMAKVIFEYENQWKALLDKKEQVIGVLTQTITQKNDEIASLRTQLDEATRQLSFHQRPPTR